MDIVKSLGGWFCWCGKEEEGYWHEPTFASDLDRTSPLGAMRTFPSLPTRLTQPPDVLPRYFSQRASGRAAGVGMRRYDVNMRGTMRGHVHLRDVYFGDEMEYGRVLPDYEGDEQGDLLIRRRMKLHPFYVQSGNRL
jgi:hypothetical protein